MIDVYQQPLFKTTQIIAMFRWLNNIGQRWLAKYEGFLMVAIAGGSKHLASNTNHCQENHRKELTMNSEYYSPETSFWSALRVSARRALKPLAAVLGITLIVIGCIVAVVSPMIVFQGQIIGFAMAFTVFAVLALIVEALIERRDARQGLRRQQDGSFGIALALVVSALLWIAVAVQAIAF
jgi:uncharacterized membrane protein YkgB